MPTPRHTWISQHLRFHTALFVPEVSEVPRPSLLPGLCQLLGSSNQPLAGPCRQEGTALLLPAAVNAWLGSTASSSHCALVPPGSWSHLPSTPLEELPPQGQGQWFPFSAVSGFLHSLLNVWPQCRQRDQQCFLQQGQASQSTPGLCVTVTGRHSPALGTPSPISLTSVRMVLLPWLGHVFR